MGRSADRGGDVGEEPAAFPDQDRLQQLVAVGEAPVNGCPADTGAPRDVVDAGPPQAVIEVFGECGVENPDADFVGVRGMQDLREQG